MERIPEHKILQFNPDTFNYVRKEFGFDKPGRMDAAIDLLDDWVRMQAHFTKKDFPREYLERAIIFNKGSVERAKKQMDKLFTLKKSMPFFFDKIDAKNDFEDIRDYYADALLPKLTKEHYRIYATKILKDGFTTKLLKLAYAYGSLIFEHTKSNDYCSGIIGILDYRDINIIDFATQINILDLQQIISIVMEGYQMRVKGVHILTSSKTIEIVVRIFKQLFSKKIGDRIQVHMTLDSLHECIPKDVLPEEFGGELKSLVEISNDWVEVFSSKENMKYMKEMNQATVCENLRNGSTMNEDILGISGSFRTLCVD